jgi:thiamine transport system permease protein
MDLRVPFPIRFALAAAFLAVTLFYPLYGVVESIPLFLNGRSFLSVLFSDDVLSLTWITFRGALVALSATLAISFGLVAVLSRTHVPLIRALFETTWIVPGFMMALIVLGAQKMMGIVDRYGFHSILIAWVLMGVPYLTLGWLRAIDDVDDREIDAFRTLGGTGWRLFVRLLLPKTWPMVKSLLVHQFYWYLISFSLVGILGGGPPNETLEVGIYSAVHYSRARVVEAVCFAIWQILLLSTVRGVLSAVSREVHGKDDLFTEEWNTLGQHDRSSRALQVAVFGVGAAAFALILFNPEVFDHVLQGVLLATASAGTSIFLAVSMLLLRIDNVARGFAWISPMIFSLAWWRAYALEIDTRGPYAEWWLAALVVAVQALLFLPWALRFLGPVFRRARMREIDALRTMGATRLGAWWRIEWPRVRSDTRFLFSIIWSFALSEVSTVILFSRGGFEPLGVWVQNQLVRFRIHEAWTGTFLIILLSILMIQSRSRAPRGGRA